MAAVSPPFRQRCNWLVGLLGLLLALCVLTWSPVRADVDLSAADAAATALLPESTLRESPAADVVGDFPPLPPDPYADQREVLPPLDEELWLHGGSYLYASEGDRQNWPCPEHGSHYDLLRLPECWQKPRPLEGFAEFLGADPICATGPRRWPSCYFRDIRFVGAGRYELLAFALKQNGMRQDVVGHNLLVDLDLRLTGTERFHVQFRPLGRRNTGGSFYRFSPPRGSEDNSTAEPDRYWFEGELHSFVGSCLDPFAALNINMVAGKFPFAIHNSLLMNDDVIGFVLSRNNIPWGTLSNLNLQCLIGVNDVDTFPGVECQVYGLHATADHRHSFSELTYAYVNADGARKSHYAGLSHTRFIGPLTLAARGLGKLGDEGGTGSATLLVLESNLTREFSHVPCGVEFGVFFCNLFWATEGWNSIAGGNFNRLRTAFEVDPLVRIAGGASSEDVVGCSLGVQLFRNHEDQSLVPEIAFEARDGESVFGFGLRFLCKTGRRTFFESLGIVNVSDDPAFDREGVFVTHSIVF